MVKHLTMAIAAMVVFGALHLRVGRIPVADGQGWDGTDYATMLRGGWERGGPNTVLRPLVVWLAQPAYELTWNVVQAFDLTNYFYVGLLAFLFSRFLGRYGATLPAHVAAILCISVSNAFLLSAYYPVNIDLGGHAMMTLALWLIIVGPRWAAAAASVAAVLAREYAPAVMIFGVIRDLRLRVPLTRIAATYLPAAAVYVLLRALAIRAVGEGNSLRTFVGYLELWRDPMWVALFVYFLLTAIAGVSLVVAAQPRRWWAVIREEPEWLGLAVPIVLVTAVVGFDIWRYLVALTPLVLVLLARCSRDWRPRETVVFVSAIALATLLTQLPFRPMDLQRYFIEFFPYYVWLNRAPVDVTREMLWPGWGWRLLATTVSLGALMVYASGPQRSAVATRRA